jgi:hypothetical protein
MRSLGFLLLLVFYIFSSGCSSNKVPVTGDELVRNELCGMLVDSGDDSCKLLREINLYSAVRHEEYNEITKKSHAEIDEILKQWVI